MARAEVEVVVANEEDVRKELNVGIETRAEEDVIIDVELKVMVAGADVKAGVKGGVVADVKAESEKEADVIAGAKSEVEMGASDAASQSSSNR